MTWWSKVFTQCPHYATVLWFLIPSLKICIGLQKDNILQLISIYFKSNYWLLDIKILLKSALKYIIWYCMHFIWPNCYIQRHVHELKDIFTHNSKLTSRKHLNFLKWYLHEQNLLPVVSVQGVPNFKSNRMQISIISCIKSY